MKARYNKNTVLKSHYKRAYWSLFYFVFCIQYGLAQQLERQVIATAGSADVTNSFTIGEVIVSTNNLEVLAGFQQPIFMTETVASIKDITNELQVYPVPTKDIVTIRGESFQEYSTEVILYSIEGRRVNFSIKHFPNEIQLDLEELPSGKYYLTLFDELNRTSAKYKILKIK